MEDNIIKVPADYATLVELDYKQARWLTISNEVWFQILEDYPHLKEEVILNKRLPDQILEFLSRDDEVKVRSFISRKRRLPYNVFLLLSKDENESVRMGIATNPKTPVEILTRMKDDSWDEIVEAISDRIFNK